MLHLAPISLAHFLILSILLVAAGIATILTKRNAIGILIGVELILNAAALNFVAFNRLSMTLGSASGGSEASGGGMIFALFVIVLAAAEAAVALAIFLNYYNNLGSIDVDQGRELQG